MDLRDEALGWSVNSTFSAVFFKFYKYFRGRHLCVGRTD